MLELSWQVKWNAQLKHVGHSEGARNMDRGYQSAHEVTRILRLCNFLASFRQKTYQWSRWLLESIHQDLEHTCAWPQEENLAYNDLFMMLCCSGLMGSYFYSCLDAILWVAMAVCIVLGCNWNKGGIVTREWEYFGNAGCWNGKGFGRGNMEMGTGAPRHMTGHTTHHHKTKPY